MTLSTEMLRGCDVEIARFLRQIKRTAAEIIRDNTAVIAERLDIGAVDSVFSGNFVAHTVTSKNRIVSEYGRISIECRFVL